MKKFLLPAMLSALVLLAGCTTVSSPSSVDAETSATAQMLPLSPHVTVRAGTDPDGEILLSSATMEGFFASDHYTDESPYGFALVLTGEGKSNSASPPVNLPRISPPSPCGPATKPSAAR